MSDRHRQVEVGGCTFANDLPMVLIGGINVLESKALAMDSAAEYLRVCQKLNIPFVFKASFDKANRSSIHSFRGPGMAAGLDILAETPDEIAVAIVGELIRHRRQPSSRKQTRGSEVHSLRGSVDEG